MASNFDIDPDLVRKLAGLLDEANLSEIEYESGGRRIRVARQVVGTLPQAPAPAATALLPAVATAGAAPVRAGTPVTSPMVGTIFLSPEPGTAPFVKVGDTVTEGQTVMLIEAMKTYNPVRAPCSGKIAQILVSDSTPVEYGEELMLIE